MNNNALKLLQSALWNKPCKTIIPKDDWKEIMHFARIQTLYGLMPDALQNLNKEQYPPTSIKMQIISKMLQVEMANKKMNEELLGFVRELEKRNIPYILLKGQGVGTYYPNPLHRIPGDIDLYIPLHFYAEANECMKTYGGEKTDESRHHIDYIARGITWELHHSILYFQSNKRNHLFMQLVNKALNDYPTYVTINDENVRVLPPTMNVALLLSHILDHFLCQGIGLRQLCDYALVLKGENERIDKNQLLQILRQLSLTRAYQVFGQLCVDYLGLSSEKLMINPTKRDKLMARNVIEDCMKGGNFGKEDHKGRDSFTNTISYYIRFFLRLIKFGSICPSEAILWPILKLQRFVTGKVHIDEKDSVLNVN